MSKTKKVPTQSRVFTASLQPAWDEKKTHDFLLTMSGVAECYVVNHDKDVGPDGQPLTPHTHVLLIYDTPRRLITIANALQVGANFVEYGHSKQALLRYLTHKNDPLKYQYPDDAVQTNSTPYADVVKGLAMTDREIIEEVLNGNEFALVGVVSMTKIRLAQSLVHNRALDNANRRLAQISEQNQQLLNKVGQMTDGINRISDWFDHFTQGLKDLGEGSKKVALKIAEEIRMLRTIKR